MSEISGLGRGSYAWPQREEGRAQRQSGRAEGGGFGKKLFEKLDADGSGGLDATELQTMIDKLSARAAEKGDTALTLALAASDGAALLKKFDGNADGSVAADEFKAGAKGLLSGTGPVRLPPIPVPETKDGSTPGSTEAATVLRQLVSAIDSNGNGKIGRRELATFDKYVGEALSKVLQGAKAAGDAAATTQPVKALEDPPLINVADTGAAGTAASDATRLGRDLLAFARLVLERYQAVQAGAASDTPAAATSGIQAVA